MGEARFLVVNADDLGMTEAVNEGVFTAHSEGVVTSASLMVLQDTAVTAAASLGAAPGLAVGLHLDLSGWSYARGELSNEAAADRSARPAGRDRVPDDPIAVDRMFRGQLDRFRELVGADPTHLDSHKHVHDAEPVAAVARRLAAELSIPLRGVTVRYEGGYYGRDEGGVARPEAIDAEALVRLIEDLPPGWTEIGCHPAAGPVPSSYDRERRIELRALYDPTVREAIDAAGIELRSFAELPGRP